MGKEWLYWISGGGGGGGRGRSATARGGRRSCAVEEESDASAGCMCAVFQLFDLNPHHQFHLNQQPLSDFHPDSPFLHGENITSRGVEAPRNSLESLENSTFQLGIQIKTRFDEFTSESCCNSPVTKTPSLVARLMGLDLLPDCTSPSLSSSSNSKSQIKSLLIHEKKDRRVTRRSCYDDDDINVRSLPESPRMSASSARARRSDVECPSPRLSLQINKENIDQAFAALPEKMVTRKQAKEKMGSRRVGLDITNIKRSSNRDLVLKNIKRNPENWPGEMSLLKSIKKHHKILSQDIISSGSKTQGIVKAPSCSLELRRSDNRKNTTRMTTNASTRVSRISPLRPKQEHPQNKNGQRDGTTTGKCSSSSHNKSTHPRAYYDRPIRNNKEEALFRPMTTSKGIKQSQVSSDALSSERSTQLSSRTSHSYRQLQLHLDTDKTPTSVSDRDNGCATASPANAAAEYRDYIRQILEHAGFLNNLIPTSLRLPIDPSIFLRLERLNPGGSGVSTVLNQRCNRKLIFQLVDELLAEIPRTHFDLKPLIEELCKKVDRFPAANCQVLEDIDSLISRDLYESESPLNRSFSGKEKGGIVCEIESELVDWLVTETAAVVGCSTAEEQTERGRWERVETLTPLVGFCGPRFGCKVKKWV